MHLLVNALELSYGRYEYDADRLLNLIQRVLDEASGTGTEHQSQLAANVDVPPDGTALGHAAQKEPGAISRGQAPTMDALIDAERIAQSITDEETKAYALADVVEGLAPIDPDRAERIARSITDKDMRAMALAAIVEALAPIDQDRAERIARSITDKDMRAMALAAIVEALAPIDPDRAERIARSITDKDMRAEALATIARALAATDPNRAEW